MALVSKSFSDIITFTRASTATFTGSNGLIQTAAINEPRLDYDPVTLAPIGLLIEGAQTNINLQSETFASATWTKTATTISADVFTAPDGLLTADKLVENTATTTHAISQTVAFVAGTTYTYTIFARAAERTAIRIQYNASSMGSQQGVIFNLSDGTITGTTGTPTYSISPAGNGWYRCQITAPATASVSAASLVQLYNGAQSYTGDGVSGVYIWGAQLEAAAFPTSYIPTVASQVTRSDDVAQITGTNFSNFFNATAGTLFAEYSTITTDNAASASITDGTSAERFTLRSNAGSAIFTVADGGVTVVSLTAGAVTPNVTYKLAGAYAVNDFAASLAGAAAVVDTSGTLPTVDKMFLGAIVSNSGFLNGHIRRITYYPTRLTNAQIEALTT